MYVYIEFFPNVSLASVRCLQSHPFSLHVTRSYSLYHCQFKSKIESAAGG